jgi:pseudaminic acid biosynthesis-associated methylase
VNQSRSQLERWRGDFGDDYVERNRPTPALVDIMERAFRRVLEQAEPAPASILEVGCNIGINLRALQRFAGAELFAAEPNAKARARVIEDGVLDDRHLCDAWGSNLPHADASIDLVFTAGVLIHIPESHLIDTVREIHRVSRRFIACLEYFSRDPISLRYRGHDDMLFKRDFGGLYLDMFPDLKIVDDGFFWRRSTGADDLTWCLLEKR